MAKKACLFYLCFFMAIASLLAQSDRNSLWDSLRAEKNCITYRGNEEKAKETYFLFFEKFQQKDYQACLNPCEWLLENYPCLPVQFYNQAAYVFRELGDNEENEILKISNCLGFFEFLPRRGNIFVEIRNKRGNITPLGVVSHHLYHAYSVLNTWKFDFLQR